MSRLSLLNFCLTSAQHDWQYQFWSLCQVCNHHSLPTYRLTHEFLWSMCCSSIVYVSSIQTICLDCADQIQHDLFDVWYLKQLHETKDWNSFEFTGFCSPNSRLVVQSIYCLANHAIMLLRTPWEKRRKPDMVFSKPGRCIICSAIPHTLRDIGNLEGISSIGWEMHQTLRACIGHLERNAKYSVKCFPKTLRDPLHTLRDISNLKIIPKNIQRFTPYLERLPPYTPWEIIYPIFRKIHPMPSDNYHIYALCRRFSKPWVRQRR